MKRGEGGEGEGANRSMKRRESTRYLLVNQYQVYCTTDVVLGIYNPKGKRTCIGHRIRGGAGGGEIQLYCRIL